MTTAPAAKRRKQMNWAPYLLILPSLIYLALFFAWPMVHGLILAVQEEGALLTVRSEAVRISATVGHLRRGMQVDILGQQGNPIPPDEVGTTRSLITEVWFNVRGEGADGQLIEGWTQERRIRVRESDASGRPVSGSVRSILSASADPLTYLYREPGESSEVVGQMEARTAVDILDQATLEVWFRVHGEYENQTVEGWVPSRYVNPLGDGARGRIE